MKAFLKEALSGETGVSSKRLIAFMLILFSFVVFGLNVTCSQLNVDFKYYFISALSFAAVCLGLTLPNMFAPKQNQS